MSFETASNLFDVAMLVLNIAGICMVTHFALSAALRSTIRISDPAFGRLFGPPAWGNVLTQHPWLMRVRYFWPWVSSPDLLALRGFWTRTLFWGARLAGAGAALGFVGWLAMMVYIGVRSA
jgi:hypothetical protein